MPDTPRSIPACAGEPMGALDREQWWEVYPRVCGGTSREPQVGMGRPGLSPRVRGNHLDRTRGCPPCGSIPACAGEPRNLQTTTRRSQVYPRVCGGTSPFDSAIYMGTGLSPRVRGNHLVLAHRDRGVRSIPACAGEPSDNDSAGRPGRVYPRVCGGTICTRKPRLTSLGLSPRVRGNLVEWAQKMVRVRSIPACAGEPKSKAATTDTFGVYPRVCGGTRSPRLGRNHLVGLSPRVRGNLPRACRFCPPDGSIPACAGEPASDFTGADSYSVYPRVCGGTPWPFDNASCYLIRQGNNGDPLAVTYQIHPSASTVSFGRFPPAPISAARAPAPPTWTLAMTTSTVFCKTARA